MCCVFDWPANSPDLNPLENLLSRGKWETRRDEKNADELKATVKETWASYHLSSATNWSPPCHAELRQQLHWLASSLCLLSTNKRVCGGRSGALWLPSHHPGGCCTLVVDEEIAPLLCKALWVSRKALYKCNKLLLLLLKQKEPLPSIEYIYSKWTYFPEGQQFTKNVFYWSYEVF